MPKNHVPNDLPEAQSGNKGSRATPEQLKAWRDGLPGRIQSACTAEGVSEEAFTIAFGELVKAASE